MTPHIKCKYILAIYFAISSFICTISYASAEEGCVRQGENQPEPLNTYSNSPLVAYIQSDSVMHTDQDSSKNPNTQRFSGNVSWYGPGLQGRKTASGSVFDMHKMTAAHLKLPFGTRVQVEDPKTGSSAVVVVNDRGPFVKTRVMDVTRQAASQLGVLMHGVSYMNCLVLDD